MELEKALDDDEELAGLEGEALEKVSPEICTKYEHWQPSRAPLNLPATHRHCALAVARILVALSTTHERQQRRARRSTFTPLTVIVRQLSL